MTPLRKILGWNELIKFRRMLGLFAFFYALLHFSTYMVLDHFFDFSAIVKDIIKRPYVTAGFTAFVLMIPLAITSTAAMIRRLGKRWQQLHRLVYVAAIAAVIHFYWLVKADIRRPVQYGFGLGGPARVPIGRNMGAAMAKVPKVPVVPFVQVVVVKKPSIAPVLPLFVDSLTVARDHQRQTLELLERLKRLELFLLRRPLYPKFFHPRSQGAGVDAEDLRRTFLAMHNPTGFVQSP